MEATRSAPRIDSGQPLARGPNALLTKDFQTFLNQILYCSLNTRAIQVFDAGLQSDFKSSAELVADPTTPQELADLAGLRQIGLLFFGKICQDAEYYMNHPEEGDNLVFAATMQASHTDGAAIISSFMREICIAGLKENPITGTLFHNHDAYSLIQGIISQYIAPIVEPQRDYIRTATPEHLNAVQALTQKLVAKNCS